MRSKTKAVKMGRTNDKIFKHPSQVEQPWLWQPKQIVLQSTILQQQVTAKQQFNFSPENGNYHNIVKMNCKMQNRGAYIELKMPEFIPNNPELWFEILNRTFQLAGINEDAEKFDYVLTAIPSQYMIEMSDIIENPPTEQAYETFKTELIKRIKNYKEDKLKGVEKKDNLSLITEQKQKRKPKCGLCKNHDKSIPIKGHKSRCPHSKCVCDLCTISRDKRDFSAAEIKMQRAKKEEEEREKEKRKEEEYMKYELEFPQPLTFKKNHEIGEDFNRKRKRDYKMMQKAKRDKLEVFQTEALNHMHALPILSSLMEPHIKYFYEIHSKYLLNVNDQDLENIQIKHREPSIIRHMKIVHLQVPFVHYLFPP